MQPSEFNDGVSEVQNATGGHDRSMIWVDCFSSHVLAVEHAAFLFTVFCFILTAAKLGAHSCCVNP
jgi:hypothetical protein